MRAKNVGGVNGGDNDFVTLGCGLNYHGWDMGGSYTDVARQGGHEVGGYLQASIGYAWENGLGVHLGWREDDREGDRRRIIGLTVSMHAGF